MIRKNNIVLVLGAGASAPYHFPTGESLVERMAGLDDDQQSEFVQVCPNFTPHHVRLFCDDLRDSGWTSIDRFLQRRQDYSNVGRAMIGFVLMPYEDSSNLHAPNGGRWYRYLYSDIIAPLSPQDFGTNQLSIITYNYDRSLEKFFFDVLKKGFSLMDADAASLSQAIPIVHVHGSFGNLPGAGGHGRPYFADFTDIHDAMHRLHIVSDDIQQSGVVERCSKLLEVASHVVFLGFGYDSVNVTRLELEKRCANARFYGTRFKMTNSQIGLTYNTHFEPHGLSFSWDEEHVDCLQYLRRHRELFV